MLLANIVEEDIVLPNDANKEDMRTQQVPHSRKVTDSAVILGAIASLPSDVTDKELNDDGNRQVLFAQLYHNGLCKSTAEGRFPLADISEAESNKKLIKDFLVVPGCDKVIAIRKNDGKEYRQGNPEMKGKTAPQGQFKSAQEVVNRNTLGIVRAIKKAARNAAKRLKDSNVEVTPAPAKTTKPKANKATKTEQKPKANVKSAPKKAPAKKRAAPKRKAPVKK